MKHSLTLIFLILSIAFLVSSCSINVDKAKLAKTQLRVIDSVRHYYPIRHKKVLNIPYHIVNSGEKPLAIFNVESSGPCIVIKDFPKGPIQKGKDGVINVEFKSDGLFGQNQHYITFEANTPPFNKHTLVFDVLVVPDEFGYGDGFDYRYESGQNSQTSIEEAVNGDETQQGYFTDSSRAKLILPE
jgi:hypothetical protein